MEVGVGGWGGWVGTCWLRWIGGFCFGFASVRFGLVGKCVGIWRLCGLAHVSWTAVAPGLEHALIGLADLS